MSAKVYSVPGQTEGKREAFLEWKDINLSYKLLHGGRGNGNYYKSVNHSIPTRGNREHPDNFQNKSASCPFN